MKFTGCLQWSVIVLLLYLAAGGAFIVGLNLYEFTVQYNLPFTANVRSKFDATSAKGGPFYSPIRCVWDIGNGHLAYVLVKKYCKEGQHESMPENSGRYC